jgi:hypothetical protein
MYDILAVLIEEAQSIPSGVMDVIISQFEGQKDKEVSCPAISRFVAR